MENEIWKDVVGYEKLYEVSNLGNVRSLHWYGGEKVVELKKIKHPMGYLAVSLSRKGKCKRYLIHRLVADAFIPREPNKEFVNHKDENKTNNQVQNLEWCNKSYNQLYSMALHPERKELFTDNLRDKKTGKIGSRFTQKGVAHTRLERVKKCLRDGTVVGVYNNASEAALELGVDPGKITSVCIKNTRTNKKRRRNYKCSSCGYVWMFEELHQ